MHYSILISNLHDPFPIENFIFWAKSQKFHEAKLMKTLWFLNSCFKSSFFFLLTFNTSDLQFSKCETLFVTSDLFCTSLATLPFINAINYLILELFSIVQACSIAQSCLHLCDRMDCSSLPRSVHGIFQARTLDWVAISSSRETFWPRALKGVSSISCIDRWILYHCSPGKSILH